MPSTVTSVDVSNLLLGLAWLGELDRLQIQRLWFAGKSVSTVEKTLARLHKEGFIARRSGSVRDEQRGVTVPQLARWSLTPAGHKEVKTSDQYPAQPAVPCKPHLLAHDARNTEVIVRLIELGRRSELSGISVAHELPLNPTQRRPVCDALVVMQFGSFDRPNLVPWSSGPVVTGEGRMRFAIEADNNTEPLSVLASKADPYRKLVGSHAWARWWAEQHGPLPVPLWVAPTWMRARAIHREWKRAWPAGEWLVTSDEGLAQNELLSWRDGQEVTMWLTFGTLRPATPAPPTSAAPQPRQQKVASAVGAPVAPAAPHPPVSALAASPSPAIPPSTAGVSPAVSAPAPAALPTKGTGAPSSRHDIARAWRLLGRLAWAGVELLDAFGGLLWRLLHVLWIALQLPWHAVRWYRALWIAKKPAKLADRTWESYVRIVRGYLIPNLGHFRLAKLTAGDVEDMLNDLQADAPGRKAIASSYAAKIRVVLSRALKRTERDGALAHNVARLAEKPDTRPPHKARLSEAQIRQLLAAAKSDPIETLVHMLAKTGLRRGEALGVRWADLDLDLDQVILRITGSVQRSPRKGRAESDPKSEVRRDDRTKSDAGMRLLALAPSLVPLLRRRQAEQQLERAACEKLGKTWVDSGLVFTNATGGPLDPNLVYNHYRALCARAGLPEGTTIHDLRHANITPMITGNVDPKTAQEMAGHSDVRVTLGTYTHSNLDLQRLAAATIDARFGAGEAA